jgi:magnesium-transporting ATPase (P-type)
LDEDDRAGCESGSTNSTGLSVFTFATLYNNFVCISMYVSLEMIYLGQAYFIQNDLELYDETTDTPAEVHSSGLLADLGQVQYVLSDKTGTITKNVMRVRRCSVGGEVFGSPMMGHTASSSSSSSNNNNSGSGGGGALFRGIEDMRIAKQRITSSNSSSTAATDERSASAQLMQDFLCIMAACNTVMLMPDSLTGELHVSDEASLEKCLQAESADEVALVLAAAKFGDALLVHRDVRSIVVKGLGNSTGTTASSSSRDSATHTSGKDREGGNSATTTTYDVVAVNTFDSDRKRMSVLIKPRQNGGISSSSGGDANRGPSKKDGDCILLCKGADNSMLPLCNPSAHTAACMAHIEEFANSGLRTLVFGMKRVSSRDANLWLQQHNAAANSLVNRYVAYFMPQYIIFIGFTYISSLVHRTALLARAASDIESGLDLVGAVGIEDELQVIFHTMTLLCYALLKCHIFETCAVPNHMCSHLY